MTATNPAEHACVLHPPGARGGTVLALRDGGRWREIPVPVDELPAAARSLAGREDVYLSQNRFHGKRRTVNTLSQLDAGWADLDFYRMPALADKHPLHVRDAALDTLQEEGIPVPSFSVATGRGLALVWLHEPVPAQALPRWNACQRRINDALTQYGADTNARDAARVLRLAGTRNSRADNDVEIISPVGERWGFDALANEVLPHTREELQEIRARMARKVTVPRRAPADAIGVPASYPAALLWTARLHDLHTLLRLRWWGELPPGHRDSWVFVAGCGMAWLALPAVFRREMFSLAHQATAGAWNERDTRDALCVVMKRAEAAARGERLEWRGQEIDPRYRLRTDTILELLAIAPEEQAHMRTLVSAELRAARYRQAERERFQRRRAKAGRLSRQEYREHNAARARELAAAAATLRSQGHTVPSIADTLQLKERQVYNILRRARETPPAPGEGYANHTGRSNHCRAATASAAVADEVWAETLVDEDSVPLTPAASAE